MKTVIFMSDEDRWYAYCLSLNCVFDVHLINSVDLVCTGHLMWANFQCNFDCLCMDFRNMLLVIQMSLWLILWRGFWNCLIGISSIFLSRNVRPLMVMSILMPFIGLENISPSNSCENNGFILILSFQLLNCWTSLLISINSFFFEKFFHCGLSTLLAEVSIVFVLRYQATHLV